MAKDECLTALDVGLRNFWTTQPTACGTGYDECGDVCARPGLELEHVYDPCPDTRGCYVARDCRSDRPPQLLGATIATHDYVRSLALNILGTDAEREPIGGCPVRIGKRVGYWADAYRTDGLKSGARLRQMVLSGTMTQAAKLAQAYLARDLQKLVAYGVAKSIDVTANYLGGATISLEAVIHGDAGDTALTVAGTRLANEWVWSA